MDKTLFIVAAGLSTRFNGKPKHLAEVNGNPVICHTLKLAKLWYSRICIAVNNQASEETIEDTKCIANAYNAKVVQIPSGKGDADAVYRALAKTGISSGSVSVCWGDAWFKDDSVFTIASAALDKDTSKNVFEAFCAVEDHPYGWFELEDDKQTIRRATFMNDQSTATAKVGTIHDQCFFNINVKNFKIVFEAYEKAIISQKTILDNDIASTFSSLFKYELKYEVSWYKMINWALCGIESNRHISEKRSIAALLDYPVAMSFNTEEDLREIEKNA